MTVNIQFTIEGQAIPTPRPRVTKGHAYYPKRYTYWIEEIRREAADYAGADLDSPVAVTLLFHTKRHKTQDIDNLAKAVLDGLTGILWDDDRVVCTLLARKDPPPAGTDPDVHVDISTWPGWITTSAWLLEQHDEHRYELTDDGRDWRRPEPDTVEETQPITNEAPIDQWARGPVTKEEAQRLLHPTEKEDKL